jgi:hypothetical protein
MITSGFAKRQADLAFAGVVGEYTFCFSNAMSTFAQKTIDFDITAEHETKFSSFKIDSELEKSVGKITKNKDSAEDPLKLLTQPLHNEIIFTLSDVHRIAAKQRSFRTRENRNIDTVKSIENRMFWVSTIACSIMVAMAVAQIYIIKTLFSKGRSRL